ncbi:MAG: hypothetical protein RL222_1910, partial [Bacteroidota bacterium]
MNRINVLFNKLKTANNNILLLAVLMTSFLTNIPSPSGYLLFIKFQLLNSFSDGVKSRALFGTLFELIVDNYNTLTVYVVYILILLSLYVIVYLFLIGVISDEAPFSASFLLCLTILLSPLGINHYLSSQMLFYLDPILIILFMAISYVYLFSSIKYYRIVVFTLSVISVLTHEVSYFLTLPVIYILMLVDCLKRKDNLHVAGIVVQYILLTILFLYIKNNNPPVSDIITNFCNRTKQTGEYEIFTSEGLFFHFKLLFESDIKLNLLITVSKLSSLNGIITLILCIICFSSLYFLIKSTLNSSTKYIIYMCVMPLLLALAMCFIAYDITRWFSISTISLLVVFAYLKKNNLVDISSLSKQCILFVMFVFASIGSFNGMYYTKSNIYELSEY